MSNLIQFLNATTQEGGEDFPVVEHPRVGDILVAAPSEEFIFDTAKKAIYKLHTCTGTDVFEKTPSILNAAYSVIAHPNNREYFVSKVFGEVTGQVPTSLRTYLASNTTQQYYGARFGVTTLSPIHPNAFNSSESFLGDMLDVTRFIDGTDLCIEVASQDLVSVVYTFALTFREGTTKVLELLVKFNLANKSMQVLNGSEILVSLTLDPVTTLFKIPVFILKKDSSLHLTTLDSSLTNLQTLVTVPLPKVTNVDLKVTKEGSSSNIAAVALSNLSRYTPSKERAPELWGVIKTQAIDPKYFRDVQTFPAPSAAAGRTFVLKENVWIYQPTNKTAPLLKIGALGEWNTIPGLGTNYLINYDGQGGWPMYCKHLDMVIVMCSRPGFRPHIKTTTDFIEWKSITPVSTHLSHYPELYTYLIDMGTYSRIVYFAGNNGDAGCYIADVTDLSDYSWRTLPMPKDNYQKKVVHTYGFPAGYCIMEFWGSGGYLSYYESFDGFDNVKLLTKRPNSTPQKIANILHAIKLASGVLVFVGGNASIQVSRDNGDTWRETIPTRNIFHPVSTLGVNTTLQNEILLLSDTTFLYSSTGIDWELIPIPAGTPHIGYGGFFDRDGSQRVYSATAFPVTSFFDSPVIKGKLPLIPPIAGAVHAEHKIVGNYER